MVLSTSLSLNTYTIQHMYQNYGSANMFVRF